eukprot:gene22234-28349_t
MKTRLLTVAGAAQVSTNWAVFYGANCLQTVFKPTKTSTPPTIGPSLSPFAMAHSDTIDQIAERVDHLLLRHEELQRTNALLSQQVLALAQERDQLKSRLAAARARVDALIERLPTSSATSSSETSS